jgi:hypothetical protein
VCQVLDLFCNRRRKRPARWQELCLRRCAIREDRFRGCA